jgi:Endonuclease-reverse transcriptase
VYNEKRQGERIGVGQYTVKRCLQRMNARERILVCGDFNAYYYWWNSKRAVGHINTEILILWLERNEFKLINIPDVPTFYKANLVRVSVINLAFATIDMREEVRN